MGALMILNPKPKKGGHGRHTVWVQRYAAAFRRETGRDPTGSEIDNAIAIRNVRGTIKRAVWLTRPMPYERANPESLRHFSAHKPGMVYAISIRAADKEEALEKFRKYLRVKRLPAGAEVWASDPMSAQNPCGPRRPRRRNIMLGGHKLQRDQSMIPPAIMKEIRKSGARYLEQLPSLHPLQWVERKITRGNQSMIAFGAYNAYGLIGPEKGGVAFVGEGKRPSIYAILDIPHSVHKRDKMMTKLKRIKNWPHYVMEHRDEWEIRHLPRMANPSATWHRQEQRKAEAIFRELRPGIDETSFLAGSQMAHETAADLGRDTDITYHDRAAKESAARYRKTKPGSSARALEFGGYVAHARSAKAVRPKKRKPRKKNPTDYSGFHGCNPDRNSRVRVPDNWPKKLWQLGRLNKIVLADGTELHGGVVAASSRVDRLFLIGASGSKTTSARVRRIEYIPQRASKKHGPTYYHPFERMPLLRRVAGGRYTVAGKALRVTPRGIEG